MAWTTPETRSTNDLISQTLYNNQVVRNLLYLSNRIEPRLINSTAESLSSGTVVTRDTDNSTFSLTTTANNADVLGIVDEVVSGGELARIIGMGVHTVNVQGNVTRGHFLQTSTASGRAADAGTSRTSGTFAIALTSYTGGSAGTVSAFICCKSMGHDIPGKSVFWTTDTAPPTYSSEYTAAKGRIIIGMVASGTLEGTVGTALSDLGTAIHSHTYDEIMDHTHDISSGTGGAAFGLSYSTAHLVTGFNMTSVASSPGSAEGTTSSDNHLMPYIQLLAIQR